MLNLITYRFEQVGRFFMSHAGPDHLSTFRRWLFERAIAWEWWDHCGGEHLKAQVRP